MLSRYLLQETEAGSGSSSRLACAVTYAVVAFFLYYHRKLSADISEPLHTCLVTATELKNQNL